MKTNELTGAVLDWAVAKCEGVHVSMARGGWFVFDSDAWAEFRNDYNDDKLQSFRPSTNWSQGGPIIERQRIGVVTSPDDANVWIGSIFEPDWKFNRTGTTPLIAAMRCYVASKLGDEIEVPNELTGE